MTTPTKTAEEIINSDIPETNWLVEDIIAEKDITILGGDSGLMKSYLALDLAINLSLGKKFVNYFQCKPAKVLYIDKENHESIIKTRLLKLKKGMRIQEPLNKVRFCIACEEIRFDKIGHAILNSLILEHRPNLVILDSLLRFIYGDEDKSSAMKVVFSTLKNLVENHNCSFLILHHTIKKGKDKKEALRGSGELANGPSIVMMVAEQKSYYRLSQVKNRHKPEIDTVGYKPVDLSDGSLKIECIGKLHQPQTSKKSKAIDAIQKWADQQILENKSEFSTKEVQKAMKTLGHSKYTLKNALKDLSEHDGPLKKIERGKYALKIID